MSVLGRMWRWYWICLILLVCVFIGLWIGDAIHDARTEDPSPTATQTPIFSTEVSVSHATPSPAVRVTPMPPATGGGK